MANGSKEMEVLVIRMSKLISYPSSIKERRLGGMNNKVSCITRFEVN